MTGGVTSLGNRREAAQGAHVPDIVLDHLKLPKDECAVTLPEVKSPGEGSGSSRDSSPGRSCQASADCSTARSTAVRGGALPQTRSHVASRGSSCIPAARFLSTSSRTKEPVESIFATLGSACFVSRRGLGAPDDESDPGVRLPPLAWLNRPRNGPDRGRRYQWHDAFHPFIRKEEGTRP